MGKITLGMKDAVDSQQLASAKFEWNNIPSFIANKFEIVIYKMLVLCQNSVC